MTEITRRSLIGGIAATATLFGQGRQPEWRNRQAGMSYRMLGRTGLMVSEVVSGGDPIRLGNYLHLNLAIEMGLNYLDMAPAYGRGECEQAYGKLLSGSSKREKVFLSTKVSGFGELRNRLYKEIFDGLPGEKQRALTERASRMIADRRVDRPGYWFEYYPGMKNQFAPAYLSNAMMQDYAHKVDGSARFRDLIQTSIEASLKRVGTDYFDILHCPHGACCPEEVDIPEIAETVDRLKKAGKVRFLGLSTHNDPAGVLRKATALGRQDMVMCAFNVINGGYVEEAITAAAASGIGVVAMKVAMSVATHHKALQPVPQWRIDKINRLIPGEQKAPLKAYTWSLQHPGLTAVISNLWDETHVRENLSVAGKKIELQPA